MDLDAFLTRLLEYSNLQEHIEDILNQFEYPVQPEQDQRERAINDGRIGPLVVGIDKSSLCGSMSVKDNIELESQSNFSSVRSNICVCKGKFMYEILLGSKGIMQLGWATLSCTFTNEEGVGDTNDSFAYDGHRVRKWNYSTAKYGEQEFSGSNPNEGDVIGCSIDLDKGEISYSRNGKDLGVAFNNVRYGPGLAYFPAVSLSYGESCQLNFGACPFKFPMEGFKPLQDPPTAHVAKAIELMNCLERLLPSPDRIPSLPLSLRARSDSLSFLTISHVFEKLGPLLTKGYAVEKVLLPFLLKSCSGGNPLSDQPGVKKMLDLMWACMEDFELQPCMEQLLFALIKAYWYQPVTLDFKHQSDEKDKAEYDEACQKLRTKIQILEDVQVEMCKILLQNDDSPSQGTKSTRSMFLDKFRKYLQENMLTTLNLQPSTACGGPVITCFYHRLIQAIRYHWDNTGNGTYRTSNDAYVPLHTFFDDSVQYWDMSRLIQAIRYHWDNTGNGTYRASNDAYVPLHTFFDDSVQYWDMSRLGGVISHLRKSYDTIVKEELNKQKSAAFGGDTLAEQDWQQDSSLVRMLDDVITLYHIAVHKQLSKGCGFAFRYTSSQDIYTSAFPEQGHLRASLQPPCPSEVLQGVIAKLCLSDVKLADEFLNGVLNQLNWAFSEFIEMLQEACGMDTEIMLEHAQINTSLNSLNSNDQRRLQFIADNFETVHLETFCRRFNLILILKVNKSTR
ncbi:E3 ubiquitin-protein ligase RNF123 [Exaiptasia diaphana]|nr:E3 ubiquitin-protein ligase RNF123 [Exaiptasia diaphana]